MTISFDRTVHEDWVIQNIADRAIAMARENEICGDVLDFAMDITACHANGCPLRLRELLEADDFNFAHDVFGIRRHLNRETGELENCFLPRFANTAERETASCSEPSHS